MSMLRVRAPHRLLWAMKTLGKPQRTQHLLTMTQLPYQIENKSSKT